MQDPTLVNNKGVREPYSGQLLKAVHGAVVPVDFKYEQMQTRSYAAVSSSMPMGYVAVSEAIKTSCWMLPFAKGDKVKLQDGRIMTVQAVAFDHNSRKAAMGMESRERAVITLEGGGK